MKGPYRGIGLSFNLNLNWPPPCTTGFFPVQQQRGCLEDTPARPPGLVYCRIPQDSPFNAVRGARNYPCETRPGKRAPTVKQCESDKPYIPLNDGFDWKGDPNATLTGQGVPQFDPGSRYPRASPGGRRRHRGRHRHRRRRRPSRRPNTIRPPASMLDRTARGTKNPLWLAVSRSEHGSRC